MSHDDNGSYPHDCYPDRRKVADRRERDRAEADRRLGLGRDRAGFEALARSVEPGHPAHGVAYFEVTFALRGAPFPLDPHGMTRDEVLRRPYARRARARTRAEFARRLVEASERPPLFTPSSHGLLQMPEPRHFADVARRNVEEAVRAFLAGGFGPAPRYFQPTRGRTMTPRDSDDRAAVPYRVHVDIRRPQRVTDAHRRDVLHLLGFGALTFRAICDRYDYEASIGRKVDRGLVRRTLRSLVDRGEVMAVKTRRPPQHLIGRKGKSKHERKPMTVYAVTAGAVALPGWAAGVPSRVALEDHVLALLVVSADLSNTGRTVLTCSSEAQAARVMAEAKRMLSSPTWTRP